MHDHELHRFKSDIHLVHYAVERYGYRRDRTESSRASHVLRHPSNDDKIVVRKCADGHWTYFSVRDDRDNGTIVDFVKERGDGRSLGHVRKELRRWLGTPRPEHEEWSARAQVAIGAAAPARDPRPVAEAFAAAHVAQTSHYLETRGLRRETLSSARFAGSWRLGARGNVLFAHHDDAGELTGFEIKNRGFTCFSAGGTKTAWQSACWPDDRALVITESAIDALSYHQLQSEHRSTHRIRCLRQFGGNPRRADRIFALTPDGELGSLLDDAPRLDRLKAPDGRLLSGKATPELMLACRHRFSAMDGEPYVLWEGSSTGCVDGSLPGAPHPRFRVADFPGRGTPGALNRDCGRGPRPTTCHLPAPVADFPLAHWTSSVSIATMRTAASRLIGG